MLRKLSAISFVLLAASPLSLAAPTKSKRNSPVYDGSTINGKTYDFVIAGGGLAGVVVAARLSEDATKTVLLIESGYDEESRATVYDANDYQQTFGTFLDWAYQTVPQITADGKSQTIRAGRALGGSTAINGLAWSKPHDFQMDAMELLGNPGLNWTTLQPYMLKAENYQAPTSAQAADGMTFSASCHGTGGPIGVQYDNSVLPAALEKSFNTTIQNLGLRYAGDLTCGNPAGAAPIANNRVGTTRIDAYRGYLYGKNVPNLTIIAGANVGKVNFDSAFTPRATGVEFIDENSKIYTVNANLEVIMATGAIKTPAILQKSGVGPASVLKAAGVTQRVALDGVGQNLIDQTTTTTDFSFTGARGGGQSILFPTFANLFTNEEAANMTAMLSDASLAAYAQDAVMAGAFTNATALQAILGIQRDWILNKGAGISESFDYSFGNTLGYDSWYLLPFGRGSIQIQDNNTYSGVTLVNPRYFANGFDRLAQGATVRLTRIVSGASPLASSVPSESTPGSAVPAGSNLEYWADWAQNNYRSNWHPIGGAAMMSKELGGCVDSSNKVYGTTGLRVVDASILPFQVSSHLMTVLYGLSERAADLIKKDHPASNGNPSGSVEIHPNGDATKCIDTSLPLANGNAVFINDCNGSTTQKWDISTGSTSVQTAGGNFCFDVGSASPSSGTAMKIWTCYPNFANQAFVYSSNYITVAGQGQCVDLTSGDKTDGNKLQTYQCYSNNLNQMWTLSN